MLSTLRSGVLVLAAVLAGFIAYQLTVFTVLRNVADLDPAGQNTAELRAVFLVLFAGLIATALLAGILVGRLTRAPWTLGFAVSLPTLLVLGFFSFYLLEFLNACELGRSLIVDARC